MKYVIAAFAAIVIAGCSGGQTGQPGKEPLKGSMDIPGVAEYALGEPVTYGNATFVPVLSKSQDQKPDQYITLQEAKKNGWVEVTEIPGQEEVGHLRVHNSGPKSLLLMGGELLLGGKQDRIVAKDTIIPPGETVEVSVYCVDHGRWQGASMHFSYADTNVPYTVRNAAARAGQQEVWDEVAKYNAQTSTGRGVSSIKGGLFDPEVQKKVVSGADEVAKKLNGNNVVGVIYVLNGDIQTFEFFGSNSLYRSAQSGLLKGFLAAAAVAPSKPKAISTADCADFVKQSLTSRKEKRDLGVAMESLPSAGSPVAGRELRDKSDDKTVHGSYTKK